MRRVVTYLLLPLLILVLLGSAYLVLEEQTYNLRARATISQVSESSFAVNTPTCASVSSNQKLRVYVYCLNTEGLGIRNIDTELKPSTDVTGMLISPVNRITDSYGKATYDISNPQSGTYLLDITCDSTTISTTHSVCFTE